MKRNIIKKGVLSLILVFSLVLSVFPSAVFAAGETVIRFGAVPCTTGVEITVPVIIEKNAGLAGFRLYVNYGAKLNFLGAQQSDVLSEGSLVFQNNEEKDRVCLIWYHTEAVTTDGELFTLRFLKQNPSEEDFPLSFTYLTEDILCEDASPLSVSVIDGVPTSHDYSVRDKNAEAHWLKCSDCGTVDEASREVHKHDNACDTTCNVCGAERQVPDHIYDDAKDLICNECGYERPPYILGDVDNDSDVDLDDAIYLLYHVNFPTTYPVNQPIDFNGDFKEDLDDAIYLLYHVNFPATYPLH